MYSLSQIYEDTNGIGLSLRLWTRCSLSFKERTIQIGWKNILAATCHKNQVQDRVSEEIRVAGGDRE